MSHIGASAFAGCRSLKSITIPEGIVNINVGAFSDSGLTSVVFPNTVTTIWYNAFRDCENLEQVYIPASVTEMAGAFVGCNNIKEFVVDNGNEVYSFSDGILYDKEKTKILGSICCDKESLTIPESVTRIVELGSCPNLRSIALPSTITELYGSSFMECPKLENIEISTSHPEYRSQDGVVYDKDMRTLLIVPTAKVLTAIPSSVTEIGTFAFARNEMSSSPPHEGITKIGERAFYQCGNLKSMTLPATITSIGEDAFYGCCNMTDFVFSDNVTELGMCVLGECHSLERVALPSGLKTLPLNTFQSCRSLKSIDIPQTVTSIGQFCFFACEALTSVSIPAEVTEIGHSAFCGCTGLKDVALPASLTKIGTLSFSDCMSLERITLPAKLEAVYPGAFNKCENLTEIYCQASVPPTCVTEDGVYNTDYNPTFSQSTLSNGVLYVPEGSKSAYQAAEGWCQFDDIREKSFSQVDAIRDSHVELSVVGGRIVLSDMDAWIDVYVPTGSAIYSGIAAKAPLLNTGVYIVSLNGGRAETVAVR